MVDDEEYCLSTMRFLLSKAGVDVENTVDFCMDGKEAIFTVKEGHKMGINYKLILTDI